MAPLSRPIVSYSASLSSFFVPAKASVEAQPWLQSSIGPRLPTTREQGVDIRTCCFVGLAVFCPQCDDLGAVSFQSDGRLPALLIWLVAQHTDHRGARGFVHFGHGQNNRGLSNCIRASLEADAIAADLALECRAA